MPRLTKARKDELKAVRKRFRIALILAEITMEQWAEQEGLTKGHLSHVFAGRRKSLSLMNRIEAFIAKHLPKLKTIAA